MSNVSRKYNSKILSNLAPCTIKTCNFRRETDSHTNGNCLFECFIYKASVDTTTNK